MLKLFTEFEKYFKNNVNRKVDSRAQYYKILYGSIVPKLNSEIEQRFLLRASVGQGNKTKYPWIAIFNKEITTTATKGLYIVFLFKRDCSGFYLSLNQGITNFQNKYGDNKYIFARKVSKFFSSMISSETFDNSPIDLVSKTGDLGNGYENTNIVSKYYDNNSENDTIISDLKEMIEIYDMLFQAMDGNQYQDIIDMVIGNDSEDDLIGFTDSEALMVIDELKKSAKVDEKTEVVSISLVDYPTRQNKTARIERRKLRKIDYAEKTKKDIETGYFGELLVFEYEKEKLRKLGIRDYEKYLKWVSKESDNLGYDFESIGVVDGKIEKIYIEVKSTSKGGDVDFYISANEVNTAKINKDNYFIYRVFDIESDKPKFYKFKGDVQHNFELIAMSYKAKMR
jgi:hypothetical protein